MRRAAEASPLRSTFLPLRVGQSIFVLALLLLALMLSFLIVRFLDPPVTNTSGLSVNCRRLSASMKPGVA